MRNFWALLFVVCAAVSSWAGVIAPSTSTLAATSGNPEEVTLTWASAGDDGGIGDLTGNYRLQYATYTVAWSTSSTPTDATTVTIATTAQVPGSAESHTVTGLTSGVTYYFVLWTEDEVPNWSGISNTTSAVGGYWFDPNQIEVDGLNGGLVIGSRVAWGDYDNDGDVDILVSGWDTTRRLRVYKNNGNGSFDGTQIELGDAGFGGGLAWGDYDNDGDLDIVAAGAPVNTRIFINNGNGTINPTPMIVDNRAKGGGSLAWGDFDLDGDLDLLFIEAYQLRVYENNGDGSFDSAPIDVDGPGEGLGSSSAVWGDFENDGDLDILACGYSMGGAYKLRVYKNNGNGTIDPAQIEVGGTNMGVYQGEVAWGDFDSDADLDALVVGYTYNDGGGPRLKVYKNNGNGTFNNTQIEVDGKNGGYNYGSAAWGDYDNDGDHDILVSGTNDGTTRQLRVYNNNGNGTIDATQIEVDGLNGGLQGSVAWGDFDNDSDLDVLASGTDGTNGQLRVYKNLNLTANTTPTAPAGLTTAWSYNVSGTSTATFKWAAGSDSGAGASSADVLTYQVEISTSNTFTGRTIVAGQWTTPGMGNYLRPPKIFDGNTNHGIMLHSLPTFNTTYYYRVKTIDTGLKESAWSATGSLYAEMASSAPFAVADLLASGQAGQGQIFLTWTAPMNINAGANAAYDVRYSMTGAITNDTEFNNATPVAGEPSPGLPGTSQSLVLAGLTPMVTYYLGIKSSHDNGTSPLDVVSPRASAVANPFDASQIDVEAINGGIISGGLVWGDFENDGDLDILSSGSIYGGSRQLRIYKNNGNGTLDPNQIEVDGANNGLTLGSTVWGDFDSDGDLDILVSGTDGTNRQLRVYKNNGNGTMDATQIEVGGLNGGLSDSRVDWGDFDNDGGLDILSAGTDGTNRQLRIYKNNGNGTLNANPIEVAGVNGGLSDGGLAWGDYDNDGDLDILASGTANGSNGQLRVYKNNGNGTMDPTQIEVDALNGGLYSGMAIWGDTDMDGDLDILVSGYNGNYQLRLYTNNGNGTIDAAQVEVDGLNGGLRYSSVAWGDFDNDGDQDLLTCGSNGLSQLRVYRSNGNGTFDPSQLDIEGVNGGLNSGSLGWGDYDNDGDLDVGIGANSDMGYSLRVYKNYCATANTAPTAPGGHSGSFSFNTGSVSVASFTWAAGTDSGTGATAENGLTYDIQLSTVSNFSSVIFPGQLGASPRLGSYLKPPKIFNSNTYYGVVMKSTDPWNVQTTASYGLRTDTTYYYRVKTVDSALAESSWSSGGSAYTGVSPSTSTLAGESTATEGEVLLTWNSAGDDGVNGNLTGTYRIQYATYTVAWSTSSTPTDATTVTIATTNAAPGSAQANLVTGLTSGLTYYFVLWSGDEVPNWSEVSNTALVYLPPPAMVTLAEAVGQPGWIGQGETQRILGTAQVVSDSAAGVTVSSVAVRETGAYTADGNLTNVEVWVSSSGYIDATAVRLDNTAKSFSSDTATFDQDVTVSTVPLYYIVRADVAGGATEGTFDVSLQVYTTANTTNNPQAFTNATDVVAPPSGAPAGLTATVEGNLLRVNLSWSGATGVDTYAIFQATHSGVGASDFLMGITNTTSFTDNYIPANQQMYYKVIGTNRAGTTGTSNAANATSVDFSALTTSNIYPFAGTSGGVDGIPGTSTSLSLPGSMFVDSMGNLYISDTGNHRIRFVPKVSGTYFGQSMTANNSYSIVGNGSNGYISDNVIANTAELYSPTGLHIDTAGNLYIADTSNHRIRFVPKTTGTYFGQAMTANYIYTIAGNGTGGYATDDVVATGTQIKSPAGVSLDSEGNVTIADTGNHRIRFIPKTTGTYFGQSMTANYIYTIAGNGTGGYVADDVAATSTQIYSPSGVSVDVAGNVYIADSTNHRIRFVPKTGGFYFGQTMTGGYIYTIAGNGTGTFGGDGGAATSAKVRDPFGVSLDADGNVYIGDYSNHRVRFIAKKTATYFGQAMTANSIYTIAGNGTGGYLGDNAAATSTRIYNPKGVSVDAGGNVYLADYNNKLIRFVPRANGTHFNQSMTAASIYTIAGKRTSDSGVSNSTQIDYPHGVWADTGGNVVFVDKDNSRIRFVPKTNGTYFGQAMSANTLYTVAGNGTYSFSGEGTAAISAAMRDPRWATLDTDGNLYVADSSNHRIRFVPKTTGTFFGQAMTANYIYTIAGNGTGGFLADDVAATSTQINSPAGLSIDRDGNLYFGDQQNNRIRFIPKTSGTYFGQSMTANYIYSIAGNGTYSYSGDGGAATSATLRYPMGLTVDTAGNITFADNSNARIRFVPKTSGTYYGQLMTANYIYTIAGNGTSSFLADNMAATASRVASPFDVSVDPGGNIYIADTNNHRIRFVPNTSGTYFGQAMTANYIYTIGGNGNITYNGENAVGTIKTLYSPRGVYAAPNHMVYLSDSSNDKIRMIASEDFVAPSTSTLAATAGVGQVSLNWSSAGDDGTYNNLTGNYRIQYATYTASWSTGSTPSNATTVTISTTNATPGSAQSYVATGLTAGLTYYFVLWSGDEVPNWSDVSNTASAWLDGTAPSTSTLSAVPGDVDGEIDLTWTSAGDDGGSGNLTGNYRIQYATYTVAWSTSSTPTDATTVTIATTSATPGAAQSYLASSLTPGNTYYFVLWTGDEVPNWSEVSNTASVYLPVPAMVTLAEAVGQPGWIGQGETQRILGTAQVVSDSESGVTISSVAVQASGYTADGNLTNVEVWVSSSGYIDATAVRLDDASKSFSGDIVAFDQDVTVSTVPLYYIVRADVAGGATEGTFAISMEIYTTANTINNPLAFTNATEVVAPPSGAPAGLTATVEGNLLRVNLSWSGASGADSYTIYRATHAGVTTTDFLLGVSNTTSFSDDYIPPAQQMHYKVLATNRAGSTASGSANATSVDVPALTTSNIYLRAGSPSGFGDGNFAFQQTLNAPSGTSLDNEGNLYIADTTNNVIRFVPKKDGTYFGQARTANYIYTIAGGGGGNNDVLATSANINHPRDLACRCERECLHRRRMGRSSSVHSKNERNLLWPGHDRQLYLCHCGEWLGWIRGR
ncbi:MAG: VCBS repeat-containing protein [Elusimicrobia bacterium]|nr:VCBS repeat-containing protein [Elusimicrobiota bacterium]